MKLHNLSAAELGYLRQAVSQQLKKDKRSAARLKEKFGTEVDPECALAARLGLGAKVLPQITQGLRKTRSSNPAATVAEQSTTRQETTMRARIFHDGTYVATLPNESLDSLRDVAQSALAEGVTIFIVYLDDTYYLYRMSLAGFMQLPPDEPRVQGLYSQAVRAERAMAGVS